MQLMKDIDSSHLEMQCLFMNKINYYKKSLEELEALPKDKKPTLLLHACCGPCSTFPLTFLCPHFEVTIFFNNSNIYPSEEYFRRLNELKKFLEYFKRDYGYDVKVIETKYDNENYNKDLEKFADQDEGSLAYMLYSSNTFSSSAWKVRKTGLMRRSEKMVSQRYISAGGKEL